MNCAYRTTPMWIIVALLVAGCAAAAVVPSATPEATAPPATAEPADEPEYTWVQLLGRDDIRPIYDPGFVPADEAGYTDDELVMGVVIEGEAKAYPVGLLNRREMVNDELAGIPILVTW